MISIAIPTRNSSSFIRETLAEVETFAKSLDQNLEIVLLDDASSDDTLQKLIQFAMSCNSHQLSVRIFQNFMSLGQQRNSLVALKQTQGGIIFLMEDDMRNIEGVLCAFLNHRRNERIDVLIGLSKKKSQRRLSSALFWMILKVFTNNRIPKREVLLRRFTREALDSLLASVRPDWTVTENCTLLLQNRSYIENLEFFYVESASRHSFWNRLQLAVGILLRFVQPKPLSVFLLSFLSGITGLSVMLLSSYGMTNSDMLLVTVVGIVSVVSVSLLALSIYGILMSIHDQNIGLPTPRLVFSYQGTGFAPSLKTKD
jgi:glycosyltransferase involved in cell wall biosynthesis